MTAINLSTKNTPHRACTVRKHQPSLQTQDPKPQPREARVPAPVRAALTRVMRAVHLHDQPRRRSEEVYDEACDYHLATELHAELRRPQRAPEHAFRLRW